MSVTEQTVKAFVSGVHNLLPDEIIPKDAASASSGWVTKDGHIELMYGRQTIGGSGLVGKNYMEWTAYKADGTAVRFRKVNGTIQTLVGSVWTDVITGLTVAADYVASNYQSLAGAFVYFFGIDGIYKVATANPTNFATLYDSARNFKGYAFIDKARSILWGRHEDPTGLYGSWIDGQDGDVYTTVSGEATTTLAGTLAFKAGGAKRTCFGVQITITAGGEVYTDNFNGVLTGSLGGTGTINYMTGAYTLSNSGVGTATYQWEDSNQKGVTDFTKSATRVAGEGFVIRQDAGGRAIKVVLPLNGSYFSIKDDMCYRFELDSTDLAPINEIYRTDIGVKTLRSAVATGKGIMFMNTANESKPKVQIIQQNITGDNFDTIDLFAHFDFRTYEYDDALLDSWDEYLIIGCKEDNNENNVLLLGNIRNNTVDPTPYGIRTSTKVDGVLYGGDPVSMSTYELFTGFDDNGFAITNGWESNGELFGADVLKKIKKERYKGKIDPNQRVGVYISLDNGDYAKIGTIRGDGTYVDYGVSYAMGTTFVGSSPVGGGSGSSVYAFMLQLKIKTAKFRKRKIKFIAEAIGYVSIEAMTDFDIWTYQDKLPARYRSKQNVSLDGDVDQPNP